MFVSLCLVLIFHMFVCVYACTQTHALIHGVQRLIAVEIPASSSILSYLPTGGWPLIL